MLKKYKKSLTPLAKERRFKRLQSKRKKKKVNKNLLKDSTGEHEIPLKTSSKTDKKFKAKKDVSKNIIPLSDLPPEEQQRILQKKAKNKLRRQEMRKVARERKQCETKEAEKDKYNHNVKRKFTSSSDNESESAPKKIITCKVSSVSSAPDFDLLSCIPSTPDQPSVKAKKIKEKIAELRKRSKMKKKAKQKLDLSPTNREVSFAKENDETVRTDVNKHEELQSLVKRISQIRAIGKGNKLEEKVHDVKQPGETKSEKLKAKLVGKLESAKFRFINEKLYTMSSTEAKKIFDSDRDAFHNYHRGYSAQVAKWPVNPLNVIISDLKSINVPKHIADFGCGEAKLALDLSEDGVHNVDSFDLVAANEMVTACDMGCCPLKDSSVDVAVFCLSLMGTNLVDFIREANRVLKKGGILKIAEVESRCKNLKQFLRDVQKCGFKLIKKNLDYKVFFLLDFKKTGKTLVSDSFPLSLEPCFYKKR